MTRETISKVQDFMTLNGRQIVDVRSLLKHHQLSTVISFLLMATEDMEADMEDLITMDIDVEAIDTRIVEIFRIYLALEVLVTELKALRLKQQEKIDQAAPKEAIGDIIEEAMMHGHA